MNQDGYIVEIVDEKTAMMRMMRMSACAKCNKCITVSSESEEIIVEVDNSIGAKVGDHVMVSMEHMNILKATAYVYVIPMIALIIGVIATYYIAGMLNIASGREIISAIAGLILMGLSYLYLKLNDKRFKESREYLPTVTKILLDI